MRNRRLHLQRKCPKTGKRRYKESLDVLLDNDRNPRHIRAYLCPHCGSWHGTSKPEMVKAP